MLVFERGFFDVLTFAGKKKKFTLGVNTLLFSFYSDMNKAKPTFHLAPNYSNQSLFLRFFGWCKWKTMIFNNFLSSYNITENCPKSHTSSKTKQTGSQSEKDCFLVLSWF